jgi:hypothetical protein
MASTGKRKTTMAKLNRERRLRERRAEKQMKRNLRKRAAAEPPVDPAPSPVEPAPSIGDEEPGPSPS